MWFIGPNSTKRRKIDDDPKDCRKVEDSNAEPKMDSSTDTEEWQVVLSDPEGFPKLLVDLQSEDPNIVVDTLRRLKALFDVEDVAESTKHRKLATGLGTATIIVIIMRKFQMNEPIQELSFDCLSSLTFETKIARVAFAQMGGVEAVVSAIWMFPDSVLVLDCGFCIIMNALSDDDQDGESIAKLFVEQLDGLPLIHKAMKNFPECASLQGSCCGLLNNLAVRKTFHKAIHESGAIVTVGAALHSHMRNEKVREGANAFLNVICEGERQGPRKEAS